jgi:hypothetical protein
MSLRTTVFGPTRTRPWAHRSLTAIPVLFLHLMQCIPIRHRRTVHFQVIAWDPFTLPVSEIITGVYFNAVGRYSDPSDSCTFRVQSNGSIPQRESITEIWNQNSVLCEYRWPGDGWQLTPPASGWTEAAVDGIIIDLWRRDVNYTGPSDDLARVDAMRLIVKTAPAPGLLQINGLWDGGNGLRYWDWAPIWDGQTATYTNFTFSNVGYSDLPISIAQPTDSRLTISPSTFTLAPGQAVWMTATFNCDGLGNLDQSGIAITNGGGQTLGFFGDCLGLPECSFDATPVDLGSMYVGDTPLTLTRTIYNTGTAALSGTVSFSNPSGAFSCPQAGTVLPVATGRFDRLSHPDSVYAQYRWTLFLHCGPGQWLCPTRCQRNRYRSNLWADAERVGLRWGSAIGMEHTSPIDDQ